MSETNRRQKREELNATIDEAIRLLEQLRNDPTAQFIVSATSEVQYLTDDGDDDPTLDSHSICWSSAQFMVNASNALMRSAVGLTLDRG